MVGSLRIELSREAFQTSVPTMQTHYPKNGGGRENRTLPDEIFAGDSRSPLLPPLKLSRGPTLE